MHNEITSIESDWERTNQELVEIFEEVRQACAPKDKDEEKLKLLRARSIAVHNERISINLRRIKEKKNNSVFMKIFDLARSMGTQEDLDFINAMVGHKSIGHIHGDIEILLGYSISEEQLKSIEWAFNSNDLPLLEKDFSSFSAHDKEKLISDIKGILLLDIENSIAARN